MDWNVRRSVLWRNMQFVEDRTPDGQRMERWPASILNERIGNGK